MARLVLPHPRYRESFLGLVAELVDEGRAGDRSMIGQDIERWTGRIDLRHELTDALREVGGHVGYDVRPSARRRGHATAMLAAVLREAHVRGIDPTLVTCDHDNLASRRVIERNGGVLGDRRGDKLRYRVPTGAAATGA